MNLEKIYLCAWIWRREIYDSENKKEHGRVQLRWTVCNGGGDLGIDVICGYTNSGWRHRVIGPKVVIKNIKLFL